MKKLNQFWLGLLAAAVLLPGCQTPPSSGSQASRAEPKLALQAFTFRKFTLAETLDKAQAAGIRYLQLYPRQELGGGMKGQSYHSMNEATRAQVLALAKAKGITLVSYGVVTGKDEADWRQIFAFAKAMGLQDIASEPKPEVMALVDRLAQEAGITVSFHNHPTPSIYANPDATLAAIKPYSRYLGLCADTGHWARSGYDPIESLRKAEGRIITLHFKDLNEHGVKTAHDVPWGTGVSNVAGQIVELRRQGFTGYLIMEYEYISPALESEVARSAEYFRRAIAASDADLLANRVVPPAFTANPDDLLIGSRGQDAKRWPAPQPVFKSDLSNAEFTPGSWVWNDGVLVAKGGGDIWTREKYGDFVLTLEFRCAAKTNSGVFLRCGDPANWLHTAIEVQILQGDAPNDKELVGAIFDCLAPDRQIAIKPGEWYRYVISARGSRINVTLEDIGITKMNLADWKVAHRNPDGTPNKFNTAYKDMPRAGRIGLQYHGSPIEFRNILVEK